MATRIDSTVEKAAEDLAKAGFPRDWIVTLVVHDPEEDAKVQALREAIAYGQSTKKVEEKEAFERINAFLDKNHPISR